MAWCRTKNSARYSSYILTTHWWGPRPNCLLLGQSFADMFIFIFNQVYLVSFWGYALWCDLHGNRGGYKDENRPQTAKVIN